MSKLKNFKGRAGIAGFHKNPQNINKEGRPASIRNQLKDLMFSEGDLLIPANQIKQIREDGSIVIKVPTQMQMAMKLSSWAMSTKGGDSLKAIKMIMEQIDGKPEQVVKTGVGDMTDEELKAEIDMYMNAAEEE